MEKEQKVDLESVLKILDALSGVCSVVVDVVEKTARMYGIIHKQAFIKYHGKEGRLVWDYLILNELTFEDGETGKQYSLGLLASDKKTEELFDQLVERYGI